MCYDSGMNQSRIECDRCAFGLMLEVHGHWQCRICNYVLPCCSGEIEVFPEDLQPERTYALANVDYRAPVLDSEIIEAVGQLHKLPADWFQD